MQEKMGLQGNEAFEEVAPRFMILGIGKYCAIAPTTIISYIIQVSLLSLLRVMPLLKFSSMRISKQ